MATYTGVQIFRGHGVDGVESVTATMNSVCTRNVNGCLGF